MTTEKYITNSAEETEVLGATLAQQLRPGDVIALYGDLGSGKTEFIKGLCGFFDVREMVSSPTFTIINQYTGELDDEEINIYHLDLYRINDKSELAEIGFNECLHSSNNIKLIEWAERAEGRIDNWNYKVIIKTDEDDENKRHFEIQIRESDKKEN